MPIPKPNFLKDAVKLLMSHSNKGQFEKKVQNHHFGYNFFIFKPRNIFRYVLDSACMIFVMCLKLLTAERAESNVVTVCEQRHGIYDGADRLCELN